MINLCVCVPDATENYIQNPAFRYATTGWTAVGSTLTRNLDYARFNIASCKVVTNGAALYEGAYYRVSSLSGISDVITASIYVRGGSNGQKVRLRLQDDPAGFEWTSGVVELQTNRWKRIEVTGRCTGRNDMRLKVETADATAKAYTFYIDGAQMERKAYATTYCDGEQPGCQWNLTSHFSTSFRTADTREGGKWVALAGTCRPNNDVYVTVLGGLGMPPVDNVTQPWSQSPGSYFQNQKILDRVLTMNFTVKKENLRNVSPTTLSALHDLRQQLVDLFKTDKTLNDEAFWFEYSDTEADKPLYIKLRYEAGLEGSWDVRNGWYNTFAVRFLAVDPLWVEDTQEAKQLGISVSYTGTTPINLWQKKSGEWSPVKDSLGNTLDGWSAFTDGQVSVIKAAPSGLLYIGGEFSTPAGYGYLCTWDGTNFRGLVEPMVGPGGTPPAIYAIDFAPDGTVYVGGNFISIRGVVANYIAKYDPALDTWSAVGTGANAGTNEVVRTICVAPNGQVYVGGVFSVCVTSPVASITAYSIARWDGLQWRTVGANSGFYNPLGGGGAGFVYSIINGNDGKTLYVGGAFDQDFGRTVTYNNVASVNIDTNLISAMGDGITGTPIGWTQPWVKVMCLGLDGTVYAGGGFTSPAENIAYWSGGKAWFPLGSGLTDPSTDASGNNGVRGLAIGKNGELFAVGRTNKSGTRYLGHCAKWFSGTWTPIEAGLNDNDYVKIPMCIYVHNNGNVYIGSSASTIAGGVDYKIPYVNTITNPGTASCWPKLYISGQGTLRYIGNIKTGQEIFLNLTVFSGEEVYIDFARGKIESTVRGNLNYTILPGSEIRSIYLLPGENKFSVLVTDDVNASMQIRWQPLDWSADAVIDAAEMV